MTTEDLPQPQSIAFDPAVLERVEPPIPPVEELRIARLEARKALADAIRAQGGKVTKNGKVHEGSDWVVAATFRGDKIAHLDIIEDTAVIKKISFADNAVVLSPVSKDKSYQPIIILEKDFKIFGKVVKVIKVEADDDYQVVPLNREEN